MTADITAAHSRIFGSMYQSDGIGSFPMPPSLPSFLRPGHVFPLRAQKGGVLARGGHTEATVDLCRLAGLSEAGLLSEIVTKDSTDMARMPELIEFSKEHGLVLTTIEDMICYRISEGL